MRVLHVASSYPLDIGDSTAPFMAEMLEALVDRGHEITVLLPRVRGLREGEREGVTVVGAPYGPDSLQVWGYGRSLNRGSNLRWGAAAMTPIALASLARKMRGLISTQVPDVVHLHWILPQGMLALAVQEGIPTVISIHGADLRFARNRLRALVGRILAKTEVLIAASSQALETIEASQSVLPRTVVIPHGAKSELFRNISRGESRTLLDIDPSIEMILGVGRLVAKKGFRNLIQAMHQVDKSDTHLFIVGSGPEESALAEQVTQKLMSRVHFVGQQDRLQVANWFAASDLVAIPGLSVGGDVDSGPVVLMEAFAAGKPVVAGQVGMAIDLVRSGYNGYLVDGSDPGSIAGGIKRGLEHLDDLAAGARETFSAHGDWSRVASKLEEVYVSVLKSDG